MEQSVTVDFDFYRFTGKGQRPDGGSNTEGEDGIDQLVQVDIGRWLLYLSPAAGEVC